MNWFKTDDIRIQDIEPLISPAILIKDYPATTEIAKMVATTRKNAENIISGHDDRLLVVVGPCSIHDPQAAVDYASRLKEQMARFEKDLVIIMRVYFEKPRTTVGWKGLINDPFMNHTFDINRGLHMARGLLLRLGDMGVPAATEFLDTITPQYIADLVSWGAIGARTTESQVHRELASGLSCPVGFKNATNGAVKIAVDAIGAAEHPHSFLSVTKGGISAIVTTTGNEDCHIILRGGKEPNYDAESVKAACELLKAAGHREMVMIDASHSNSKKICRNQILVVDDICAQVADGSSAIIGVMIESNLVEGRQDITPDKPLTYGQSVTDACLGWDDTVKLLEKLARAVRDRRSRNC